MRDKGKKLTGSWPSIKMKAAISLCPYCPSLRWSKDPGNIFNLAKFVSLPLAGAGGGNGKRREMP
jgi:hypothetical protein